MTSTRARQMLKTHASPAKAAILQGFFKTGPGQYGEGDIFIGVKVPEIRAIARKLSSMPVSDILSLLHSKIHEERLLSLIILTDQFDTGDTTQQKSIFDLYLNNTRWINNWDLVDISAPKIPGTWLLNKDRQILYELTRSSLMWERRIAIVSTFAFIRNNALRDTFNIAKILLNDKEDLMHKATGWMLREAGKRDVHALKGFLDTHLPAMPRTMLRYAIERFPEKERLAYLRRTA
jgi:3-methyladenine DNA glycosylase AlkD